MKLFYIYRADSKSCPRAALSLYQSCPDVIEQVHESPSALSHPDAGKPVKGKNPEFYKSLKKVYDRDKLHKEGAWTTEKWWTGKHSLLAGFFLSEEDAKGAIGVYVKERNKHNKEVRRHERENHTGYSEEELAGIYPLYEEKDFAVGSIDVPNSKESAKIRKIEPKKHCGNCRFRIVEHNLERREPMGCLYHLDARFYEPMAQVCARWKGM